VQEALIWTGMDSVCVVAPSLADSVILNEEFD
jgi:hypothetical protein